MHVYVCGAVQGRKGRRGKGGEGIGHVTREQMLKHK